MSGQQHRAANQQDPSTHEEQVGLLLAAFLEARERDPELRPEQFLDTVPEKLREAVRAAIESVLWLEAVEPHGRQRPEEPSAGKQFGHYRLIQRLGEGTGGTVYLAEHTLLKRRVALKLLAEPWTADPGRRERFEREARAIARLHHTNIAPLFEYGRCQGRLFFAMQYIEGWTLAELICYAREGDQWKELPEPIKQLVREARRRGGFRPQQVAEWGAQAAAALAHAHGQGVIHRDIKPSNLVLDRQGRLWVVDFGLALLPDDAGLTLPGVPVGTPRYMSPEVARGGPATERSDLYSLAAVLYELLTLRPVLPGEEVAEVLEAARQFEGVRFERRELSRIGRDLAAVVQAALEPDPRHRLATAEVLAEELRRVLAGEPVRLRRWATLRTAARWARRHAAVTAVAGVLGTIAIGLAVWRHVDVAAARRQAETNARRAESALRQARAELVRSHIADARAWVRSRVNGRRAHALRSLQEARRYLDAVDGSVAADWWDAWLAAQGCPDLTYQPLAHRAVSHPLESLLGGSTRGAQPEPWTSLEVVVPQQRGQQLVVGTTRSGLLFRLLEGRPEVIVELPGEQSTLCGSAYPWVVAAGEDGAWAVDLTSGAVQQICDGPTLAAAVASAASRIAVATRGTVAIYELAGTAWEEAARLALPSGPAVALAWDWAGKLLAVVTDRPPELTVYTVPAGRAIWRIDLAEGERSAVLRSATLAFLPTGQVALGLADGSVRVVSPQTGLGDLLRSHRSAVTACVAVDDGVRLMTADRAEVTLWNLVRGEPLCPSLRLPTAVERVTALSAGEWLVGSAEGWYRVRFRPSGRLYRALPVLARRVVAGTFCASSIVLAGADGELLVVGPRGEQRRYRLPGSPQRLQRQSADLVVCYLADGRRVVLDVAGGRLKVPRVDTSAVGGAASGGTAPSAAQQAVTRWPGPVAGDGADRDTGELLSVVRWHGESDVLTVALVAGRDGGRDVLLWRSDRQGKLVRLLGRLRPVLVGRVEAIAVSEAGDLLVMGGPREPARRGPGLAECWRLTELLPAGH